jgi:hypothetical protein
MKKIGDSVFIEGKRCNDNVFFYLDLGDNEKITVLDRLTGFSGGIRDIETGYMNSDGRFWLASGNFDIREFPELTINEAIAKIKDNANTCIGV